MFLKYKYKTPFILRTLYPECEWKMGNEKMIYLTFDDGPIPEVTEYVLEILNKYHCKATFFCVGENVYKNPEIYRAIVAEGHEVGNHTYNHVNGWKTKKADYIENVKLCEEIMLETVKDKEILMFRPPYGKLTKSQSLSLKNRYRILMWDLLTRDFDQDISPEKCLSFATKYTENGSIVIFHDSLKARQNMQKVLPLYLEFCLEKGYIFSTL